MKTLFILHDAPYGSERTYNGLRLAASLTKAGQEATKVFLIGDAASCARRGQKVPEGFYNLDLMLGGIVRNGAEIGVCGRHLHECARDHRERVDRRVPTEHAGRAYRVDAMGGQDSGLLNRLPGAESRTEPSVTDSVTMTPMHRTRPAPSRSRGRGVSRS